MGSSGVCVLVPIDVTLYREHLIETHICSMLLLMMMVVVFIYYLDCVHTHTHDSFATALVVNQHDSLLCMPLCIYDNCAFQIKFDPDFTVSATKKCKRIEETQLRSVFKGERETLGEVDNTTSRPSHKYPYTICKICKCKLIIGI